MARACCAGGPTRSRGNARWINWSKRAPTCSICFDEMNRMYDTIIIGGGPAGLSAALVLGRCRRKVLVCDAGHPRNERSKAMHGFLSRDGMPPAEFGDIC